MAIDLVKFINRQISRTTKNFNLMCTKLIDSVLIIVAYLYSFFSGDKKKSIPVLKLKTKSERDLVINCLGCTDLRSDTESFGKDLRSIRTFLTDADISFTSSRFGKHSTQAYSAISKLLNAYHITDVAYANKLIKSRIYQTEVGNVAVCACMMHYASASKHHRRLELVQEYYLLKQMGADYVIMYLDSKQQKTTTEKNKQLCDLLLKAGVDYVVNVKPGMIDSGVTFRQRNGSVSRAVYSVGTFLSDRNSFPEDRAVIRIKLRRINGKLQAFEEAYYPLRYSKENGFKNLIDAKAVLDEADIATLAKIENSMPRLRRVDRILTVKTIMELIGAGMSKDILHLQDFSVGKVRARSFEVMPGDIFFHREPFADPNDLKPLTRTQRLRIAKTSVKKGALLLVTFEKLPFNCPSVMCNDIKEAHIAVCAYLRRQFDMTTIGITGSIGKTSTKDMLAEVMKMQYRTVKSEQNTNVQVKIGENLQKINSACEIYIQEMGGGRPGGASRHARMVLPEVTVVTNIGDAHLGNFYGDKEALMHNKLGIIEGMPENGVVYLNGDDPLLVNAQPACKKVLFAVHNHNADYYAEDIETKGNQTVFKIVHDGHKVTARLNVPGEHNVLNAVCAFAIGKQFDIPEETIVKGISNFKTQGIRQNIVQACGMKLFLDCFNASSGSVESSIKTLTKIKIPKHGKRIALVGDITGLGELSESTHKEIAVLLIDNPADIFIFYGKDIRYTYEIIKAQGLTAHYVSSKEALCQLLTVTAKPGDVIMAKGSSKMELEYAFDCAFGTRFFDGVLIEENAYYRAEIGGVIYNLFRTHATAVKPHQGEKNIRIRSQIGAVRNVKALVVACNTATAAAAKHLRMEYTDTIIIGIEPALKPAVETFPHGTVGILATPATLQQGKLERLIARVGGDCHVKKIPAPGLVELVEHGMANSIETEALLRPLLEPWQGKLDGIVLGCTHYPFAAKTISRILPDTMLFDGGEGTARNTRRRLSEAGLLCTDGEGCVVFENSSDDPEILKRCWQLLKE